MTIHETTVTSKGQVTIPVDIRRKWRLETGDGIEFFQDYRGDVCIRPCNAGPVDFLGVVPPRKRSLEFVGDDDALADVVIARNISTGKGRAT
jgi:antitoxin PrlF